MSKVYEAYLQMEELAQDQGWQEMQEEQQRLTQEDLDVMVQFEQFIAEQENNVEENKAKKFAQDILETA